MESLTLVDRIKEIILDKQGEDILVLDLQEITVIADYFVICTGTSNRQINALYSAIRETMKKEFDLVAKNEGTPDSGWILMDYNGVIVHLFNPEMREFYQLDSLWKNAHVVVHIQ